jgi:tellurite resistance protein TerB
MASFLSELLGDYRTALERHRNRPFLKATMAACALVAIADGDISLSERIRVDQILDTLDELRVFDPHEAVDLFNEYVAAIRSSPRNGRAEAMAAVQEVAGDLETAALLMRVCLAISEAGGVKPLVSQIEVVMLCSLLGVEPKACGLYTDRSPEDILKGGG